MKIPLGFHYPPPPKKDRELDYRQLMIAALAQRDRAQVAALLPSVEGDDDLANRADYFLATGWQIVASRQRPA